MGGLLRLGAFAEAATGLALMAVPAAVSGLLLGTGLDSLSEVLARVAGIAIFSLGIACWPGDGTSRASVGLLIYGLLIAIYLSYLGIRGEWVGALLWPAVAAHVALTTLLAASAFLGRHESGASSHPRSTVRGESGVRP